MNPMIEAFCAPGAMIFTARCATRWTLFSAASCWTASCGSHYAEVERLWQDGDTVELTLDMRVMPVRPEDYGVSSGEAPYMALRRGPLVLARDARLGQSVDAPVELVQNDDGSVAAALSEYSPLCCVVAMDVQLADGTTMPVIDYASAGKTGQEDSRMCAWIPMKR